MKRDTEMNLVEEKHQAENSYMSRQSSLKARKTVDQLIGFVPTVENSFISTDQKQDERPDSHNSINPSFHQEN